MDMCFVVMTADRERHRGWVVGRERLREEKYNVFYIKI